MSSEIIRQQNFQERMMERICESIGELMTDEELKQVVDKAVDQVFFQNITLKDGFYSKEVPPVIHGVIKELLAEKVNKIVDEYIQTHTIDAERIIKQVTQEGLGMAVIRAFSAKFQGALQTFEMNLKEQLNQY